MDAGPLADLFIPTRFVGRPSVGVGKRSLIGPGVVGSHSLRKFVATAIISLLDFCRMTE